MNLEETCKAELQRMLDNGLSTFLAERDAGMSFEEIAQKHTTRLCKYDAAWAEYQWKKASLADAIVNDKPHQFTGKTCFFGKIGISQLVGCVTGGIFDVESLNNRITGQGSSNRLVQEGFDDLEPMTIRNKLHSCGIVTKLKLLELYEQGRLINYRGIGKTTVSAVAKYIGEPDPYKKKRRKCPHCGKPI